MEESEKEIEEEDGESIAGLAKEGILNLFPVRSVCANIPTKYYRRLWSEQSYNYKKLFDMGRSSTTTKEESVMLDLLLTNEILNQELFPHICKCHCNPTIYKIQVIKKMLEEWKKNGVLDQIDTIFLDHNKTMVTLNENVNNDIMNTCKQTMDKTVKPDF